MSTPYIANGNAAAGGKGGSMGGFQTPTTYPSVGQNPVAGGTNSPAGGKGGGNPQTLPSFTPPGASTMPAPTGEVVNPQGPDAFEQGLNAMNQGMDWFGNQLGYTGQQLGGDYNAAGLDSGKYMSQLGKAGGGGYRAAMMSAPDKALYDYNAAMAQGQSYQAQQLSDKNINDYMNPYTQSVIDSSMNDLDKARQQAINSTGVAATQGGAFGGDRHAIMESQNNADYMDQVARTSSQLRNQGYQNAQQAAMGDVNSVNQQRGMTAQMAQQANMANQAAMNDRSQFMGSTANSNAMQTGLANQSATNAASALGAQLGSQASIANANNKNAMLGRLMGYENANNQFNSSMDFAKDQFNAGQAQQDWQNQFNAANQYYGMGNDRWGMAQDATDALAGAGNQIDGFNQQLINQIKGMFDQQTGAPQQSMDELLASMGGLTGSGSTTTSSDPGLMGWLGAGAGLAGAAGGIGWKPFGGK